MRNRVTQKIVKIEIDRKEKIGPVHHGKSRSRLCDQKVAKSATSTRPGVTRCGNSFRGVRGRYATKHGAVTVTDASFGDRYLSLATVEPLVICPSSKCINLFYKFQAPLSWDNLYLQKLNPSIREARILGFKYKLHTQKE